MAKVSVIIPVYNREDMIVEAVESALAQTLQDHEVIVVDDGSTDDTAKVVRERFGDQVRYLYQENRGRSSARNCGLMNSRGKYVVFLDSDDILLPQALETLSSFLDAHPDVEVVYSDGYLCDEEGRDLCRLSALRPPVDLERPLESLVRENFIIAPHCVMVQWRSLERIGPMYFDETLSAAEDTDLWIRLAVAGCRFGYVDVLTCKYRWYSGNTFLASSTRSLALESMRKAQFKILQSGFFATLSLETKRIFCWRLLLYHLRTDAEAQQAVFDSPQFQAMCRHVRAAFWYYVGVDNIINGTGTALGRQRLKHALRLAPRSAKYRAVLLLSYLGDSILGWIIGARREIRRKILRELPRSTFDPRFRQEGFGD